MVFYETYLLVHGRFSVHETRLLIREASRAVVERDGAVFRIMDLGWRHTAQPVVKKRVGKFHFGRWYSMTWGGPPTVTLELRDMFQHNTGVLRHITQKLRFPKDTMFPRSTYYPLLRPDERLTPPMTHHTLMGGTGDTR
uniref:Ribosomal protein S6 n=1 Tax=Pyrodinium bahamense TaxID=73915 RepID=A0A7S0AKK1_9DINO|mmetsp:Transcript_36812/g.102147  ORF Transcript_36812/g.102147 Transcript_36812/m.102147 type:complete len:139 (+) Transcript_36812:94-510(+)